MTKASSCMPPTTSRGNLVFIKGFLTRFSIRSTSTPRGGKLASLIGSPRCKISTLFLPTCWRSSLRWALTPLTLLGGGPYLTTIGSSQTTLSSLPSFVLFTILWANQTVSSSMASATARRGVQGLRQELGSRFRQSYCSPPDGDRHSRTQSHTFGMSLNV